jgi:UDP-N-acetylglucosamine 4,6-dehydratase
MMKNPLRNKTILVTGGTGTFGRAFVQRALTMSPKKIIVFSRDEFKQWGMEQEFNDPRLRFFIGDVRDESRLARAFDGVDYVIHAAALKQVPACEYNPSEALKTNAIGAMNVVNAAIDRKVKKVVALSTDKAVNPVNLYGATKTVLEKIITAGNAYSRNGETALSLVRYGNVAGSRGSVIPFFQALVDSGQKELPLTHEDMTRFHITIDKAVDLVLFALSDMKGGECYIPKIPSFYIKDLISSLGCTAKVIGIRKGEKLHETLVSADESDKCYDIGKYFVITDKPRKKKVPPGFCYVSNVNDEWLY